MKLQLYLFVATVVAIFSSCTTTVDWDEEINRLANGQTVVVPVGDATITLDDLLEQFDKQVFGVDERANVFVKYNDTIIWKFNEFDNFDESNVLVDEFSIYNEFSNLTVPEYEIPIQTKLTKSFPHTLSLGFNAEPTKNRIDRAEINSAKVEFELTTSNLSIQPQDITITVRFPSDFLIFDATGDSKIVYKPTSLNSKQIVHLNAFKLFPANGMTSVNLDVDIEIKAVNTPIVIRPSSKLNLKLRIFDVDPKAYFGLFTPAISLAQRNQTVDLSEYINLVPRTGVFKLAEPEILLKVHNNSGIRLGFQVDSLKAFSSTNPAFVPVYAKFNNNFSKRTDLGRKMNLTDQPSESTILLNHEDANGNIDVFFDKFPLPNMLFYRFYLLNDIKPADPLNFITPTDHVQVHVAISVPLKLNAGSSFSVKDTIENVDFNTITRDEFIDEAEIIINVTNAMPLQGSLSLKMLDVNKQPISGLSLLTDSIISAPLIDDQGLVVSGGEKKSEVIFKIDKTQFAKLKTVRFVEFEFLVEGDENKKITFRNENFVRFQLGILLKGGKIIQVQ